MKSLYLFFLFLVAYPAFAQEDISSAEDFLTQGENNRAKEILERRISKNATDWEAIGLLGDILSFEKRWDEAIFLYKKLLTHDPKNPGYNFKYGGALGLKALNVSKLQAVVYISDIKKYLESAARLDAGHIKSRRALVELYMQLPGILGGSKEKAGMYANQLRKINVIEALLAEAFIHTENDEKREALLKYREAMGKNKTPFTNPTKNYLNYEFGTISAEHNLEPENGLEYLNSYIINYSYRDIQNLEWAYLRKAQIHAHLSNKNEAIRDINKALYLNKNFKEAKTEKRRIQNL